MIVKVKADSFIRWTLSHILHQPKGLVRSSINDLHTHIYRILRRNSMFKKSIIAGIMVVILLLSTPISANAGSGSWYTVYGTLSGTSSTYTWSHSDSPMYRRIEAVTKCSQAVPHIAAEVFGYYNGTQVMHGIRELNDSATATATADSSEYAYKTITGNGCHAIWSSTLTRHNYYTSF